MRIGDDGPDEAIFRLAPMTLVQFYVTIELARDLVFELGQRELVHFRDLNLKLTPFQRTFIDELRRTDELQVQLHHMRALMDKYSTLTAYFEVLEAVTARLPTLSQWDELCTTVAAAHDRLRQLDESYSRLAAQHAKLSENKAVLEAYTDFTRNRVAPTMEADEGDLLRQYEEFDIHSDDDEELDIALTNLVTGTIATSKLAVLRKVLWRALRGNLYFNDLPLEGSTDRLIFIIFAHGDVLKARARKIISLLDGVIFDNVQGTADVRADTLEEVLHQMRELGTVVELTRVQLINELVLVQDRYPEFAYNVAREQQVYLVLNMFDHDLTRRCLVAEGWVAAARYSEVQRVVREVVQHQTGTRRPSSGLEVITIDDDEDDVVVATAADADDLVAVVNQMATNRTPPTWHKTNKFTGAFQLIIDAYGVATYQEVNPGLATIVTFPFMFAIMFGDLGHGIILFLIALYLVLNEAAILRQRNRDEIFDMAFTGRYVLLLMGAFSIYTGLIYNDIFLKLMTIFGSRWHWPELKPGEMAVAKPEGTYPFGIDWAWHGADNNLLFINSYKMKMLVLLGYVHMNYLLMFSLVNYRFFQLAVDVVGNFIPLFLFMQLIFGYLSITIVYKWCVDWFALGRQPPGLLNILINMFLLPGTIDIPLYPGQGVVQVVLLLIALVCVPWLLIYKPYMMHRMNKAVQPHDYAHIEQEMVTLAETPQPNLARVLHDLFDLQLDSEDGFSFPNEDPNAGGDHDHEGFNMGDVIIHQVIHTIEFCLNCVSHTASYLRLWALSLAHAQLLTVLWDMTIANAFGLTGTKGVVMTVILFGMWFVLTVAVLVGMEGTLAMLHSLRLHWVEAMSKFFEGEGYAFTPFVLDIDIN